MQLDVAIMLTLVATVAIVLLLGAGQKLRDLMAFEMAVEAYELLPQAVVKPFAYLIPLLEITAAALLCYGPSRTAGALLALLILTLVTAAVVVNLLRGRTDVGCGCGGLEDEQPISWTLVGRNALLGLAAMSCFAYSPRELIWLDYLSVAAGAVCCYGIYVMANQLIANQPRLIRLRQAS